MNSWKDDCLSGGVLLVILTVIPVTGVIFTSCSLIMGIFLPNIHLREKIVFLLGLVLFMFLLVFLLLAIKEELGTIKRASLLTERIECICHYYRKFTIHFNDIKAIKISNVGFFMKNMRLFHGEKKGFDIELKNGRIYRVSPHMSDLESLKHVLIEGMEKARKLSE